MNVFPVSDWGKVFLVVQIFLLAGCIEGQPWQPYSSKGKTDVGEDTTPIKKDSTADLRIDLAKGCSSSCVQGEVCDPAKNVCVQCTTNAQCGNEICDDGDCVECVEHSDCPDIGKANCSENRCVPCDASVQCGHLQGALSCNNAGTCVCENDNDCDGGVCDRRPASLGICDYTAKSAPKAQCKECISDSECRAGSLCVLTNFEESAHKYFCLAIQKMVQPPCADPYIPSGPATSVGGIEKEVCQPSPTRTTCEAVIANITKDVCTSDDDCPSAGFCRSKVCTYSCRGGAGECDRGCSDPNQELGYCL